MPQTAPTDRATFALPYDALLPRLREVVTSKGMKLAEAEDHSEITLSRGVIRALPQDGLTGIELVEVDAIGGQVLRDLLDTMADQMGLPLTWAVQKPHGLPANLILARVVDSITLSPSFHRVVVTAPDLARFGSGGLHFTLPQGPKGAGWPYTDHGGVTRWPEGIAAWHRPVFTTRTLEPVGGDLHLTFDVFLHAGGRTPGWAAGLRAGDEVALMGPSGSAMPKPADWLGIVADETAVPVAARILAACPADTVGQVTLFVPVQADVQRLDAPAGVRVDWVLRGTGDTPVAATERLGIPPAEPGKTRYVLFAAEKAEAAQARDILGAKGLVRGEFLAASYWSAP